MTIKKLRLMRKLCLVLPMVVMTTLVTLWFLVAFLGSATGIDTSDKLQTNYQINNLEKSCTAPLGLPDVPEVNNTSPGWLRPLTIS